MSLLSALPGCEEPYSTNEKTTRINISGKPFVLEVSPGECSDGMSDRRYGHVARFVIEGAEYRGCADAPEKFSGEGEQP